MANYFAKVKFVYSIGKGMSEDHPIPHNLKQKEMDKRETFLTLRTKGIRLFKVKNDLNAFFWLEKAYNILSNREDRELESYLLQSAYKGIWSSYSKRLFELMEYLAFISIRLAKKKGDLIKLAKAYNGRSLALYLLGKPSIEYNQKASIIFEEIIQNNAKLYNRSEIKSAVKSKIKNNFGKIINLGRDNNLDEASALADSTIQLSKEYNLYIEEALTYKIKGNLFFFFKNYDIAFEYLFKSHSVLSSRNTKESQRRLAYTSLLICENYFKLKRFREGLEYLSEADKFLCEDVQDPPYTLYAIWGDYYDKYKKDKKKAIDAYWKAVSILNISRWSILSETNIDSFLKKKDKEDIYLKLIKNLIQVKDIVKAFNLLEQFRAKVFIEKVLLGTEPRVNLSRTIIEERKEITRNLRQLYKELDNNSIDNDHTHNKIKELNDRLYDCDEKLISASLNIVSNEDNNNTVHSLKDEQIEDSLNKIPNGNLIVTYFYYDNYVYIFLLYRGSLKIISQYTDSDIESLVRQYIETIKKPNRTNKEDIEQSYYKEQMITIFIEPIKTYLGSIEEIIIIPFKVLHLFPLHNLFLEIKEDILISYLPNFRAIDYLSKSSFTSSTPILLIGDTGNDLINARKEVKSISKMFREPCLLIGKNADKQKAIDYFQMYSVVHYSGHIRFNDSYPLYSFLEFGGSVEGKVASNTHVGDRNASLLFLQEIYALNLSNIKFLSLGGCSSGLGRYYLGEEVVGLLKGFFYAGVKSILSTFWDIDDRASKEFIELFFEETLASEGNKRIGFSKAYKKMKGKYKDTFFYGGFGLYEGF